MFSAIIHKQDKNSYYSGFCLSDQDFIILNNLSNSGTKFELKYMLAMIAVYITTPKALQASTRLEGRLEVGKIIPSLTRVTLYVPSLSIISVSFRHGKFLHIMANYLTETTETLHNYM